MKNGGNEMATKAILFDFGNVLGVFDHMKACERIARFTLHAPENIYRLTIGCEMEHQRQRGEMSGVVFYKNLQKMIGFDGEFLTYPMFSALWGDIFLLNKGIEKVLKEVARSAALFVLSNTEELHWRYIERLPVMQTYFSKPEQQILSFRVGARKPDRKIFAEAIKRSGFSPINVVYLDDVSEYVDTFRGMGGQGINYNCKVDSIEKLRHLL